MYCNYLSNALIKLKNRQFYIMRSIIIISTILISVVSLYSQGNNIFENEAFEYIQKIETAQKNRIKTINYYPNYEDSMNKGECEKLELYDSNGILLKEIYYPNSKKEYFENAFEYNTNGKLKTIYHYLSNAKTPFSAIHLDYNHYQQLKSMTKEIIKGNIEPDTLFYFYTIEGRFDYKVWSHNRNMKINVHYNKCNRIEYIEGLPYKQGSIQLDSNDCIIFGEIETGENKGDIDYFKRINNNNCQIISEFSGFKIGKEWNIHVATYEYDMNHRILRIIYKAAQAKTMSKCVNKLKVKSVHEFEYNNKGLQIFHKTKNGKGNLTKNLYIEYTYF